MEYIGPSDWYFWLGVEKAFKSLQNNELEDPELTLQFNNKVCSEAIEAFKWGFCLGLELTENEYIELTTYPEETVDTTPKVVVKSLNEPKDEADFETSIKITGNC